MGNTKVTAQKSAYAGASWEALENASLQWVESYDAFVTTEAAKETVHAAAWVNFLSVCVQLRYTVSAIQRANAVLHRRVVWLLSIVVWGGLGFLFWSIAVLIKRTDMVPIMLFGWSLVMYLAGGVTSLLFTSTKLLLPQGDTNATTT